MPMNSSIVVKDEWDALPENILEDILIRLGWRARSSCSIRLVCKDWKVVHDNLVPTLTLRYIEVNKSIGLKFPNVHSVSFDRCFDNIESNKCCLVALKDLPRLTHLSFDGMRTEVSQVNQQKCRVWRPIGNKILASLKTTSTLTSLDLKNCVHLEGSGLSSICRIRGLENLSLHGCYQLSKEGCAHLPKLSHLTALDLTHCSGLKNKWLKPISKVTSLVHLTLSRCPLLSDKGMSYLSRLSMLKTLNLTDCQITETGVSSLCALTCLASLDLSMCGLLNDEAVLFISQITTLTHLSLADCTRITDVGFGALFVLDRLKHLNLHRCGIMDVGLASLCKLTSLLTLNIRSCKNIIGYGLHALSTLQNLEDLNMLDTGGTQCLPYVGALVSLTSLDVSFYENIRSNDILAPLCSLPKLAHVTIDGFHRMIEPFSMSNSFPSLTSLTLLHCQHMPLNQFRILSGIQGLKELKLENLRNDGLLALGNLVHLKSLSLSNCPGIKDHGLKGLCSLTALTYLCFEECSSITSEGLAAQLGSHDCLRTLRYIFCIGLNRVKLKMLFNHHMMQDYCDIDILDC